MSNQIFYISGNRKFYINENSGVLVLNNLDLRTNSRPTINGTGVLLSGEGATLPSTIVYTTGSQTIGGSKTFSSAGAFISGLFGTQIIGLNVTAPNLIYNTGNQTISGVKTFATSIDIANSLNPQSLRVFNKTGTNSGEFGLFGWQNNNLIIGSQATNSGIFRNTILTGNNINISPSGNLTFSVRPTFNNTGILISGEAVNSNGTVNSIIRLTQAQYDALSPKDANTFYVIVG